jgi:hypothetical protein
MNSINNQSSESTSQQQVKMYTLSYDPGHVEGHIVMKKHTPIFEDREVQVGYEWVENDIGSWMGPQRIQVPKYETQRVLVGHSVSWVVYTPDEYNRFAAQYE